MISEDTDTETAARPPKHEPDRKVPGKLHGSVETRFHTGEAVALINGRAGRDGKAHITGLKGFAKRSQTVMSGSGFGDPFADYALVQIEHKLDEIDEWFREKGKALRSLAEERLDPGISPESSVAFQTRTWSTEPIEEQFVLGHYGSMALVRLKQFDELVLLAKGLLHHHVITNAECHKVIEEAGNNIRGLLAIGNTYDYWGCTRDDLRDRTRRGMAAVAKLKTSRFINPAMFTDDDDICSTFADYDVRPRHLPDASGADAVDSSGDDAAVTDAAGDDAAPEKT